MRSNISETYKKIAPYPITRPDIKHVKNTNDNMLNLMSIISSTATKTIDVPYSSHAHEFSIHSVDGCLVPEQVQYL